MMQHTFFKIFQRHGLPLCSGFCSLLLLTVLTTTTVRAQTIESSWFEIELIAFSRQQHTLLERFDAEVQSIDTRQSLDFLSELYQPDLTSLLRLHPACPSQMAQPIENHESLFAGNKAVLEPMFAVDEADLTAFIFWQQKSTLQSISAECPFPVEDKYGMVRAKAPASLPVTPHGDAEHQKVPYLLTEAQLQLKDLAYQLRHRGGHQIILHTSWRQTLSSKKNAQSIRWFGGQNLTDTFRYDGQRSVETEIRSADLQHQIKELSSKLAQNPSYILKPQTSQQAWQPQQVWQLDGAIKIFSERMLFAETEFNLRSISADGESLQTFYSADQTRLLIGDVHYLDHPKLGIILQIRRFTPPALPLSPEQGL